ncbi:MAG: hypothetical protein RXS25_26465, partial [Paraburkholderia sp.]|uniref:hypothetical protein n=1 Tax=Paraburkholderia sp. TaxID=1926495 RepID=UPI00397ADD3A
MRAAVHWALTKIRIVCWVYVLIDALRGAHENTKRESVLGAYATLGTSESMWTVRFKRCAMGRVSNAQTRAKHHEQFPARRNTVNKIEFLLTFKSLQQQEELEGWQERKQRCPAGRGWR